MSVAKVILQNSKLADELLKDLDKAGTAKSL